MANENLTQTKNTFKMVGNVVRIDKDNAYKQDEGKQGTKNAGKTYRSLRFGVKTSDDNENTVQMFSFEPEKVFLWNSEKKKADKNYKGDRVDFDEWLDKEEEYREQGYAVLQTRIGLEYGEDGKLVTKGLPSFISAKEIYDGLTNGDSVVVEGNISYSSYENQQGKRVEQINFNIEKLYKIKDVDFESDKFEERSYFEQEIVFVDAEMIKEEKKVLVTGRHINYNKSFHDVQFVINYADGEGKVDKDMEKLAKAFANKMSFGDVLNVFGNVVNRVIIGEVEDEEEEDNDDDLLASLGGKSKPKHAQKFASRTYVNEMQIEGVDAWDKAVYTEDDFEVDSLLDNGKEDLTDELGGKKKGKTSNPFDTDDDDIDDEDLPF
jgi:hypothetical protein